MGLESWLGRERERAEHEGGRRNGSDRSVAEDGKWFAWAAYLVSRPECGRGIKESGREWTRSVGVRAMGGRQRGRV